MENNFKNRFYRPPKETDISRESILLISAVLKYLIYATSENCFHDKALPKAPLPNVFVLFINTGHFIIFEKVISFLLDAG